MNTTALFAFILTLAALAAAAVLLALHDVPAEVFTGILGVAIGGGGAVGAVKVQQSTGTPPAPVAAVPQNASGRQSVFPS